MRKEKNANFQTMIPRELFEEINVFLTEKGMTKVDFIKKFGKADETLEEVILRLERSARNAETAC